MRRHLKFRSLHPQIVEAATTLIETRPSQTEFVPRQGNAEAFLQQAGEIYSVPVPTLFCQPTTGGRRRAQYNPLVLRPVSAGGHEVVREATIVLRKWSVLGLFEGFRLHLLESGFQSTSDAEHEDALNWACSLYYAAKPVLYRSLVRRGRVEGVQERDLYTTASWERIQAESAEEDHVEWAGDDEDDALAEAIDETFDQRAVALPSMSALSDAIVQDADQMLSLRRHVPLPPYSPDGGMHEVTPPPDFYEEDEPVADVIAAYNEATPVGFWSQEAGASSAQVEIALQVGERMARRTELEAMSRDVVRQYASDLGIRNVSSFTKTALIAEIIDREFPAEIMDGGPDA